MFFLFTEFKNSDLFCECMNIKTFHNRARARCHRKRKRCKKNSLAGVAKNQERPLLKCVGGGLVIRDRDRSVALIGRKF